MDIVKIFSAKTQIELQCDINEWLKNNKDKYVLKQISYSAIPENNIYRYSAMLWYTHKTL